MMASTHMAYGFVAAYFLVVLIVILPPSQVTVASFSAPLALLGMFGAFLPDIDGLEFSGPPSIKRFFVHRKTLHYVLGYLMVVLGLVAIAAFSPQHAVLLLGLACVSLGAWVHSIMDPLDGWRDDEQTQGVYEHITRRWLPSRRLVMFAGIWEWIMQALAAVFYIAISANISQFVLPGWQVTTIAYFAVWSMSVVYDVRRASERQSREREAIHVFQGLR